jgi:cellulose/xylan binding protein with CBM9 domain
MSDQRSAILPCHRLELGDPQQFKLCLDKGPFGQIPEIISLLAVETGKPLQRETKVKIAWNNWGLYFLFHCEDPSIWCGYTKDNEDIYYSDVVETFLSPEGSLERYLEFELSPTNLRFAAKIYNPHGAGTDFRSEEMLDCSSILSRVQIDRDGEGKKQDRSWQAFLGVPFSLMGLEAPSVGDRWQGNILRIDMPNEAKGDKFDPEFGAWVPNHQSPANFHLPEYFGTIEFVE